MDNQEERKVYRETLPFDEIPKDNEESTLYYSKRALSVEQILNGEFDLLSQMGVDKVYIHFFETLNLQVFKFLPRNWDMDEYIIETCSLISLEVRYMSDEEIRSELAYGAIKYIIDNFLRWKENALKVDADDVNAYNIQLLESQLLERKIVAKYYLRDDYIFEVIKATLDLFLSLKKEVTLVYPKSLKVSDKQKNNQPTHLMEILLKGRTKEFIESNYLEIMSYLFNNNYINIENEQPVWIFSKKNATNKLLAGFLFRCQELGYLNLADYSAPRLKVICENTFNITMENSKAFQPSSLDTYGPEYAKEFVLMPIKKTEY
nr:hypothetical protein [uncultured Carboxylicivirga sp.]